MGDNPPLDPGLRERPASRAEAGAGLGRGGGQTGEMATRRTLRSAQAVPMALDPTTPCPCGLPASYDACCARFHRGEPAPTAELLMRSRYSAFAVRDADYLLRTWHPTTRPARLVLDPRERWLRLEILGAAQGGLLDAAGEVTFRAEYAAASRSGATQERSRFVRVDGRWAYLDAQA